MASGSFSRTGGSIGLAVVLVLSSLVMVAVESPQPVSASTGCTSGSVSTTTEIGRNYLGESDEFVSAPRVSSDRKLHRYTKVTFTSNGVSDGEKHTKSAEHCLFNLSKLKEVALSSLEWNLW